MGSLPLLIVLTLGAVSMVNELEETTYKDGMLRNSIISEHITELCEKNFAVLHALALNPLVKQYVVNPASIPRLTMAEIFHNANNYIIPIINNQVFFNKIARFLIKTYCR